MISSSIVLSGVRWSISMATVTHTIYSRYDPQQRELLERETGQFADEDTAAADSLSWQTESSVGRQRRPAPPPRFVPATTSYDEWDLAEGTSSRVLPEVENDPPGNDLAGWYRSLTNSGRTPGSTHPSFGEPTHPMTSSVPWDRYTEKRNKNNWFIMKAMQSEPVPAPSTTPSTLADILARDPPPLPTQEKYTPPVWLTLGPSNKGFAMLQQSGWNEGEALGPSVIRRGNPVAHIISDKEMLRSTRKSSAEGSQMTTKREVIDLTLSNSDLDNDDSDKCDLEAVDNRVPPPPTPPSASAHSGTALLTPIATVLKSDRLGIGLKAKTFGPHKVSQKRVTHNAAAMAAHISAAEELRKRKKEVGRGQRGFNKTQKAEEANRKRMLAYLNED